MDPLLLGMLTSFFAVSAGAIMVNVPKKFVLPTGTGGAICWVSYLIFSPVTNDIMANFWAGLVVAFYSQLMARVYKTPVTIFFIPGFLPLVPGYTIYRAAYYFIVGDSAKFSLYLSQTLQIATLIALAIIISDTCFKAYHKILKNYKKTID